MILEPHLLLILAKATPLRVEEHFWSLHTTDGWTPLLSVYMCVCKWGALFPIYLRRVRRHLTAGGNQYSGLCADVSKRRGDGDPQKKYIHLCSLEPVVFGHRTEGRGYTNQQRHHESISGDLVGESWVVGWYHVLLLPLLMYIE